MYTLYRNISNFRKRLHPLCSWVQKVALYTFLTFDKFSSANYLEILGHFYHPLYGNLKACVNDFYLYCNLIDVIFDWYIYSVFSNDMPHYFSGHIYQIFIEYLHIWLEQSLPIVYISSFIFFIFFILIKFRFIFLFPICSTEPTWHWVRSSESQ